jgi:hypothetical protein
VSKVLKTSFLLCANTSIQYLNVVSVQNCGVETCWKIKKEIGDSIMKDLKGASNCNVVNI